MAKYSVFYAHICDLAKEKGITLDDAALFVKNLGYEAVECDYRYIKKNFDTITYIVNKYSFKVSSAPCFFFFDKGIDEEFIDTMLMDLKKLNCSKILAIPGEFTDTDTAEDKENKLKLMVKGLKILTEKAEKYNIDISLEDFDSIYSPCATDEGLEYFFNEVPKLKFNMDTGNFAYMDLDTLSCCKKFAHKIKHIHLKDRSLTKKYEDQLTKETAHGNKLYPASIGSGFIPMKELIKLAKCNGYEGFYSAENSCPIHMEEFLTESIKWMKENI